MSADLNTAVAASPNVVAFPDRGGAGWRCDPEATWGSMDMTNVSIAANAFWRKHGAGGYAVLGFEATPAMLAQAAVLQALAVAAREKGGAA